MAGGGGDELNASCYSTVERRREEGGAAQRRWPSVPFLCFFDVVVDVFIDQSWISDWTV